MKPTTKKKMSKEVTITSVEQFKELYFPSIKEAREKKKEEEEFGNIIAMSVLDGINKDLKRTTKK